MFNSAAYGLILCVLGLTFAVARLTGPLDPYPMSFYEARIEPMREGQTDSLRRVSFADDKLWLLSDAGELWTVREGVRGARQEALPEPAYDFCAVDGQIVVATGPRGGTQTWTVRQRVEGGWRTLARVAARTDGLVGLVCEPGRAALVTSRRLVELGSGGQRTLELTRWIPSVGHTTVLLTPTDIIVGKDIGEFGGGLQRIDRRTGEVRQVERNETMDFCGPSKTGCDMVTGLAAEPWKPGCVVMAAGLVHATMYGRVVEICGERVRTLYTKPCPDPDARRSCSLPFFSLSRRGDTLVLAAADGFHQLDASGGRKIAAPSTFKTYGPFRVDFSEPDAVYVMNSASQRYSVGPPVPMAAPR